MSYVLLVEDNQNNADMMIRLLDSIGLRVKHTLRGFEGAQLARQERPLLILMDFNLPDIDGRVLSLQLRKQLGSNAAPPIIAITARAGVAEARLAQQFGCSAFISKPFAPEEFISVIKQYVPATEFAVSKPVSS